MNGLSGTRRSARPVRLALTCVRGGEIDGAWWPYTGSVAGELPGLIEALHQSLGEIVTIKVSWGATDAVPDLDSMREGARTLPGTGDGHQRLMMVDGRLDHVTLLVVPHRTTSSLGLMVLRRAAELPISEAYQASPAFNTAGRVMCAARTQSAQWAERSETARVRSDGLPTPEA